MNHVSDFELILMVLTSLVDGGLLGLVTGFMLPRRYKVDLVHHVRTHVEVKHILPIEPDDPADKWKLGG